MKIGTYTDTGKTRPLNEDDCYVSEYVSEYNTLYAMVADGMGGHNAGEVASSLAIGKAMDYIDLNFSFEYTKEQKKKMMVSAYNAANESVYRASRIKRECRGMGTTLTVCLVCGDTVTIANVGDSRAYLLRGNTLHQITQDHSLVYELLKTGQITEDEAKNHPNKNVITRAIGTDPSVDVDVFEFAAQSGDIILLCSDGLSNMVSDDEIKNTIKSSSTMMLASQRLVNEANDHGGLDNITAVLLQLD